jgi:hypothetical protein
MAPVMSDARFGRDRLGIAKIKSAWDVLRGVVKNHAHVDRHGVEHLAVRSMAAIGLAEAADVSLATTAWR